jgi:hypothetical protein
MHLHSAFKTHFFVAYHMGHAMLVTSRTRSPFKLLWVTTRRLSNAVTITL